MAASEGIERLQTQPLPFRLPSGAPPPTFDLEIIETLEEIASAIGGNGGSVVKVRP